jgi:hypothetical protein
MTEPTHNRMRSRDAVRRGWKLATAIVLISVVCGYATRAAQGGVYLKHVSPRVVAPGGRVELSADSGIRLFTLLPLYVIRQTNAPRAHVCHHGRGICEPFAPAAPASAKYRRIGTLNFRHSLQQNVSFSAPSTPGKYVFVFYCARCYKGPGGSLVTTPKLVLVVR